MGALRVRDLLGWCFVPLLTLALIPVNRRRGDLEYARERPAGEAQALADPAKFGGAHHALGMCSWRSTGAV